LKLVLDTGVLMLILKGDPAVKEVVDALRRGAEAYTATTNMAELYYKTEEKLGRQVAITWFNRLIRLRNLTIISVDTKLALRAGELKAKYGKQLSLADAIIIALAEECGGRLLTTDSRLRVVKEVSVEVYGFSNQELGVKL